MTESKSKKKKEPKPAEPASNWTFVGDDGQTLPDVPEDESKPKANVKPVSWTTSEYPAHDKSAGWYLKAILITFVFAAIIYLITKDKMTTGIILFVGVMFSVYSGRKPRDLNYTIDSTGVTVGEKTFFFDTFRSFSVVDEGDGASLLFVPLKRFMPMLTIYYPVKYEDKIMDVLNNRLPMDNKGHDSLDRFLRRIKY